MQAVSSLYLFNNGYARDFVSLVYFLGGICANRWAYSSTVSVSQAAQGRRLQRWQNEVCGIHF